MAPYEKEKEGGKENILVIADIAGIWEGKSGGRAKFQEFQQTNSWDVGSEN